MTEDEKQYWDKALGAINAKMDDVLDKLAAVRADTDGLKGHVLYTMGDNLTLSQRITKLEEALRRPGPAP